MRYSERILMFAAAFMIELILFMPFYISDAYAEDETISLGTLPMYINVTIPDMHNSNRLHITGETNPYSDLKLYINDIYERHLGSERTSDGNFAFNDVLLKNNMTNTIRIVAEDTNGNLKEKIADVYVDSTTPRVTIADIPSFTQEKTININGSVNEAVHMDFYVISIDVESLKTPSVVESLHVDPESLNPNSLTLAWIDNPEEEEVEKYLVYRSDIGLIATIDGTPFTDMLVDSNKKYIYQVSALNIYCNEGPKFDIEATTPDGGQILGITPEKIEHVCEGEMPQDSIDIPAGAFSQSIELFDGPNKIRINITDSTGNSVIIENSTYVDTKAPEIIKHNILDLDPSYVKDVTIEGMVSENATVHIYINNETNPEESVRTRGDGTFSADVTLERTVSYEEDPAHIRGREIVGESGREWINFVNITVVDDSGLSSSVTGTLTYALCGEGADWDIDIGVVTPDVMLPRMLIEGIAQIGFDAKFKWQGPGDENQASITHVELVKMPLNIEQEEDYDMTWIKSMPAAVHDSEWKNGYFLINLRSPFVPDTGNTTVEQENNISDHRGGECGIPDQGCIKIPLIMNIQYNYYNPYNNSQVEGTQKQCIDLRVMIDKRLPPDKIPKAFLNTSIKLLSSTINLIDKVLDPVKTAREWVFLACGASWVLWWLKKASEWGSCMGQNPETCDPGTDSSSDKDDEKCRACLMAKSDTVAFWIKSQWLCDRIMCPSAPTVHKYIRDAKKEGEGKIARSHCANQDESDIKFNAISDTTQQFSFDDFMDPKNMQLYVRTSKEAVDGNLPGSPDEKYCEYEYYMNYNTVAMFMNELEESYCLWATENQLQNQDDNSRGITCGPAGKALRILGGICTKEESNKTTITVTDGQVTYYYVIEKLQDDTKVAKRAIRSREIQEVTEAGKVVKRDVLIFKPIESPIIMNSESCKINNEVVPYNSNTKIIQKGSYYTDKQVQADNSVLSKAKVPEQVYMTICQPPKEYVVDPTSGLITSFRSVCLTAMAEYLQHWRTILVMVRNCLQTILYTGDGSAGVCKQVLTIYLCDLIYFAIKCIKENATKGFGTDMKVKDGISGFLGYMQDSSAKTQQGIQNRYGTSSVYKTLFVERKLIHSVCAFAFTGDWDLDIDAFLEEEIDIPIKTSCFVTGTRRFLTKDPSKQGKAKFLYHIGAFIVSGANDLRYDIELVCSGTASCSSDIDPSGYCDCLKNGKGEQSYHVNIGPGNLDQGGTVDDEAFIQLVEPYRYDTARIKITYNDAQGERVSKDCGTSRIMEIGHPPPADCSFDLADLSFHCEFEWGERGFAFFKGVVEFRDDKKDFFNDDKLYIDGSIEKQSRSSEVNDRMALRYKIYRKGSSLSVYKDVYVPFSQSNPTIMDLFNTPLEISSTIVNKVRDDKSYQFNPFVDITQQTTEPVFQGIEDPFAQPDINPRMILDDVKGDPIEIKIFPKGTKVEATGCTLKQNNMIGGSVVCTATGISKTYDITVKLKDGKTTADIVKDTTLKIFPPQTQVTSAPSERVDMVLELSLHYINPETNDINPSPISTDGASQVKTMEFVANNRPKPVAGIEGRCDTSGYNKNNDACYCDPEKPTGKFDCGEDNESRYCYQKTGDAWICAKHPKCKPEATEACDCNLDGMYTVPTEEGEDCDNVTYKYCYDNKCHKESKNFPPELQSVTFYSDNTMARKIIGDLPKNEEIYLVVVFYDNDNVTTVSYDKTVYSPITLKDTFSWKEKITTGSTMQELTITARDGKGLKGTYKVTLKVQT